MRKVFLLVLMVAMVLSSVMPAYAAIPDEGIVSPMYDYIQKNSVGLSINETTGIATCTAHCYALNGYTVKIECKLQRYESGSWTTVKTWTTSGTTLASLSKTWAVYSGYTYRTYAAFRIYNSAGSLLESTVNTKTYYYP